MKIDLSESTFIIPLKIDSEDRINNLLITTDYILRNFKTNIIILEADIKPKAKDLLDKSIDYIFYDMKEASMPFHRTKFLNIMLSRSNTKCVINYDIDAILPLEAYKLAHDLIINDQADLVYPFEYGKMQHEINNEGKVNFKKNYLLQDLIETDFSIKNHLSEVGHCQFFNRQAYIDNGMENEYFISYGPEDKERFERFLKLKKRIHFIKGSPVYHLQHYRGQDSSEKNIYFHQNWALYKYLYDLKGEQIKEYYAAVEYKQKYNNN